MIGKVSGREVQGIKGVGKRGKDQIAKEKQRRKIVREIWKRE
jgi:hypothetical protein